MKSVHEKCIRPNWNMFFFAPSYLPLIKIYLEGECPIVITVEEESVEDRGEGGVPHVDQEGGQELHHGGELKSESGVIESES